MEADRHRGGRFGWRHVLGFMGLAVVLTAGVTIWWYHTYLNASLFEPTVLTPPEQEVLDTKLSRMDFAAGGGSLAERYGKPTRPTSAPAPAPGTGRSAPGTGRSAPGTGRSATGTGRSAGRPAGRLAPEAYSEAGVKREIELTEKELNSLVAKDEMVARRVAIDLADDLVSVKLLVPMEEDFPLFGGRTLRLNLGVTLGYTSGQPVVALRGVSLGGVPLPNAWLGDIKNVNLVEQFGDEGGFWQLFARGVEDIQVRDGYLRVKLQE